MIKNCKKLKNFAVLEVLTGFEPVCVRLQLTAFVPLGHSTIKLIKHPLCSPLPKPLDHGAIIMLKQKTHLI